jgi:hypothetical protein
MFKSVVRGMLLAAVVAWLASCGGGEDPTKARLRFVNASSGYVSLDLVVDDERRFGAVPYAGNDTYVEVDPDQTDSDVRLAGGSTALVNLTPSLQEDHDYTLLAYGGAGALKTLLLDENNSKPDSGKTRLRVVNAAPDAGSVDVYVTGSDELLTDAVPLQSAAVAGTVNGFVTISSGTRRLRITAAGSKTDLRIDLPSLGLGSEQVATLVITPGSGGVLVNVLLLREAGGLTRADTPQARVRAVAGVTDGGTVAATLDGKDLLAGGVGAPAIGAYVPVAAGAVAPAVSVNGVVVGATSTLTPGADYTMMVYGPASAPVVVWLADDNRLPSDLTQAKVRLVHGLADLAGALALKVNTTPLAGGVLTGTASAYALQAPTTTATLSVTGAASALTVSYVEPAFVASGNYSVFVLGAASAPAGVMNKDR